MKKSDKRITTICVDPSAKSSFRVFNTNDWQGTSREIIQSCTTEYSALQCAVDRIEATCSKPKERCRAHFETLRRSMVKPIEIVPTLNVFGQVPEAHILIQAFFSGIKSLLDLVVQLISSEKIVSSHVKGFNRHGRIYGGRVLNRLSNNVVSGRNEVAQQLSALISEHKQTWIDEVIESRDRLIHPTRGVHQLMFHMELAVVDSEVVYKRAVPPVIGDEPIDRYAAKRLADIKEFSLAFLGAVQKR